MTARRDTAGTTNLANAGPRPCSPRSVRERMRWGLAGEAGIGRRRGPVDRDLEDKSVNKIVKGLIRFLIEVVVITVLIVGIRIFTDGMYLLGLPDLDDIQSVNISYPSVTENVKEISSRKDIELALKLTGFLKYDLFGEVNSEEEPDITITYFLKDGTSKTISANNTTVWWNNKIHVIKEKEMFINLTEGIFFLDDLQAK